MEKLTLSLVLGAALGSGFRAVFGSARSEISTVGAELKKTQALASQVGKMNAMQVGAEQTRQKLQEARKEAERLRLQQALAAGQGEKAAAKAQKEWERANRKVEELSTALGRQRQKISDVGSALRAAGVDTRRLSEENERLGQSIAQQEAAYKRQQATLEKRAQAMDDMKSQAIKIGAAVAYVKSATGQAIEFESAMADVKKVVDFDSPEQFKLMGQDIQKLASRLPMTAEGIAAIVAAGGQAGFARGELLQFAEDATKMGVAFDTTADEAGQMMAQWRTAFKMPQKDVVALADQINYLGNTGPANAGKISEIVTRIGPLGEVAGVASGEIAALGSTVAGMGIAPEIAATGIKNLMLGLNAGASATKSQKKAFKELGLEATDVGKRMQKDAAGTITMVLKKIQQLPKEAQAAALDNLFGKESIGAIAPLLTNLDKLQENLGKVGDATKYAGSMQKEYESRAATTANNVQLMKNNFSRLGTIIGNVFLPPLNLAVTGISWLVGKMADLADRFPVATAMVVGAITAWLTFKTVVAATTFALTFVPGAAAMAGTAMGVLGNVMRFTAGIFTMVGTAARVLWAVLMANPIILIGAAIAGAAFLIYKYWEPISGFFKGLWNGISAGIGDAVDWILGKLATLTAPITWVMEKGAAIGKALGFGGGGSAQPAAAGNARSKAAAAVVAGAVAASPMAAAGKPAQVTHAPTYQMQVHAAPGMDEKKLAEEVRKQMEAKEREAAARKRSAMHDPD